MVERDSKQKDSREPLDEECGQPRGAEINPQLIAKEGPQTYSHRELEFVNNLSELGSGFFLRPFS